MTIDRYLKTCTRTGCYKPHYARGLCRSHYEEFRVLTSPACTVDGCNNGQYAKGLCRKHHARIANTGRIEIGCSVPGCNGRLKERNLCKKHLMERYPETYIEKKPECTVEGCNHPQKTKGLCNKHYLRWYRNHTVELANGKMD